jgi:predicted phosphatase
MSRLFKREKQLIIGEKIMPDLEIDFNVTFNADDVAPINDVTVYNASPSTLGYIQNNMEIKLNAGYSGNLGNIIVGTIASFNNRQNGIDSELKILVNTDINAIFNRTVAKTYAPGTNAQQILEDLLRAINIETGTIFVNNNLVYEDGKSVNDTYKNIINEIVKETASYMFVRNNILYIVDGVYELDTGYLLRPETGLIGSPEEIEIDGAKGYKFTMCLNPMMTTGSVFRVESKNVNGLWRVQDGTHSGSNFETVVNCLPTDKVSRYVPPVKNKGVAKGNTNKDKIWNYLTGQGFSRAATAGVMGNWEQESGYDPNADEGGEGGALGYGGYGIAQWTGGRREALFAAAAAQGKSASDLLFQLDYFMWEITAGPESDSFSVYGGLSGGLNEFKAFTDPIAACLCFEESYERAGIPVMGARYEYAQAVYDWNGQTAGTYSGTGGDGNFPAGAFQCECGCGLDCVPELKDKMNQLWDIVGPLTVTGPARCQYQNGIDGGVPDSLHLTGEACDVVSYSGGVDYVADNAQSVGLGTLRYYGSGFTHCQTYPTDRVMD